ncbi:uncharacterized protein LOC126374026 isoform X1 [Pectinophora gossypiella]|uniref:uncharacterized protein LOC126374026 isoform X1 n=1 Tax=Pectinophora gossypiella TaxID=13191 RepID=UPI00214ECF4C|nr:uncharacterized protein LOC126374026 isoform X1 [Pectinophora gossypiella]
MRVVYLVALVGLVTSDGVGKLDKIIGYNWTGIVEYGNESNSHNKRNRCDTERFEATRSFCTCGPRTHVPVLRVDGDKVPVIIVDSPEELQEVLKLVCDCKGTAIPFLFIFRTLSDDYYLFYNSYSSITKAYGLISKKIPTKAELEEFISNNDVVKGLQGDILCVKDYNNNKESTLKMAGTPDTTDAADVDAGAAAFWSSVNKNNV